MANSFPVPPTGWQLSQVSYQAVLPHPDLQAGAALDFGTGTTTLLTYSVPVLGLAVVFATPGSFGTFDQTTIEAGLTNAITGVLNVLANMSGVALATLESQVTVTRIWEWISSDGTAVTTSDTMTYTPV